MNNIMAHMEVLATIILVLVYSTTALFLREADEKQQIRNHWDQHTQGEKKLCELVKFGPWSDRLDFSISPNPIEYEKGFQVHLEFYVYEDLWFGTAEANATQVDGTWHYALTGILCDVDVKCPWHKGETLKFQDSIASLSTYVDKGTYTANLAIYNEDSDLIFGFGFRNCTLT